MPQIKCEPGVLLVAILTMMLSTSSLGYATPTTNPTPSSKPSSQPSRLNKNPTKDLLNETVIQGRILGFQGKPIQQAHIELVRLHNDNERQVVQANAQGKFTLKTKGRGLFRLYAAGVFHRPRSVYLWLRKPERLTVDVLLAPLRNQKKLKEVKVIGDFNQYSYRYPKRIKKGKQGTYLFTMDAKQRPTMTFQMFAVTQRVMPVHLPQNGKHVYDKQGAYKTILLAKNKRFTFSYNPKQPWVKGVKGKAPTHFKVTPKTALKVHDAYLSYLLEQQRMFRGFRKHREAKKKGYYQHNWKPFQAKLRKAIKATSDPETIALLTLVESGTPLWGSPTPDFKAWMKERRERVSKLLKKLPSSSPLWALNSYLTIQTLQAIAGTPLQKKYAQHMAESHKNVGFRFYLMQNLLFRLGPQVQQHKNLLKNPNLPPEMKKKTTKALQETQATVKSYIQQMTRIATQLKSKRMKLSLTTALWNMRQRFPMGTKLPPFKLPLLDQPNKAAFTEKDLKGKCTLLIFWATWCGPCIQKMPKLHKMHKLFGNKGLQMVSISYDTNLEAVKQFRKEKWKLPWYVSVAQKGYDDPIAHFFEIAALPSMIFVGPDGRVKRRYVQLKKGPMQKLLAQYLAQQPTTQPQ